MFMAFKKPESMDDLIYFTVRDFENSKRELTGVASVWVYRKDCSSCGKAKMGKPLNAQGKPKIRATFYECPSCSFNVPKKEYEESLNAQGEYTCPECVKNFTFDLPFKRKTIKGVPLTFRIVCEGCGHNIDVSKKMKQPKSGD